MIGRDVRAPRAVVPGHGRTVTVYVTCACGARFEQEQRAVIEPGGHGFATFELPCPSCDRLCAGTVSAREPPPGPDEGSTSGSIGGGGIIAAVGLNGREPTRGKARPRLGGG